MPIRNFRQFFRRAGVTAFLIAGGWVGSAEAGDLDRLFGHDAAEVPNLSKVAGWADMSARHAADKEALARWLRGLDRLAPFDRVAEVHARLNRRPYVADAANYGHADYWAAPSEFLAAGGDCEDFAIAKYFALRALGVDAKDLRVVLVHDRKRNVNHAVLAIALEGRVLVLDNREPQPQDAAGIDWLSPRFALSESAWWVYRRTPPASAESMQKIAALATKR